MPRLIINEDIRSMYGIELCTSVLRGIRVIHDYDIEPLLLELKSRMRVKDKDSIREEPIIRALRGFYWSLGIDPTKIRPSSEALLRRFLTNYSISRINNVVDAGNIASIETLIPIGIYDLDMIQDELRLRYAFNGERFIDISNHEYVMKGIEIVLADSQGIVHLFPHRDSLRTSIKDHTSNILVVGCGVKGIAREDVERAVYRTIELIREVSYHHH